MTQAAWIAHGRSLQDARIDKDAKARLGRLGRQAGRTDNNLPVMS